MKILKRVWRITFISFIVFYLLAFTAQILTAAELLPKKKPNLQGWRDDNISFIKFHIKQNEGFEPKVYEDTRGNLTVGYGHKLPKKGEYQLGDIVDNQRLDRWFDADFNDALRCARRYLKNDYNYTELTVITDMAFNLGCTGLHDFWRLQKHINNKDYKMAVKAIVGSNYYNQLKNRADRNIRLINQ